MTMTRAVVLSIVLAVPAGLIGQSQTASSLAPLQGSWVATSVGGKELPAGVHIGLTIVGEKYREVHDGRPYGSGTVKVDASKKPRWLDFVVTEGPDAGKTQLCLVEPAGDTMTMALGTTGSGQRPASLSENAVSVAKVKPLPATLEGAWAGVVVGGGAQLRLIITLTNSPDGLATGTLTSVDQDNRIAPIAGVLVRGARLTLIMPAIRGTFDAQLKDGQLTGTWTQPGGAVPLVLKRNAGGR